MVKSSTRAFVEEKTERPKTLKARYQIGSQSAPMNYPRSQTVFHVNDIPASSLAAKKEIQASLKSKILRTDIKPRWSVETKTGDSICHRRTYVNSTMNRSNMMVYNYRAEKLPSSYPIMVPRPNKFNTGILEVKLQNMDTGDDSVIQCERLKKGISRTVEELPNHPALVGKQRWNISSDITAPVHHEKFIDGEKKRFKNSGKWSDKLSNAGSYASPQEALQKRQEALRKQKLEQRNQEYPPHPSESLNFGLFDKLEAEAAERNAATADASAATVDHFPTEEIDE